MDAIIGWIGEHYPMLGLLFAVGFSTWHLSAQWKDVKRDINDLKDKTDAVDNRLKNLEDWKVDTDQWKNSTDQWKNNMEEKVTRIDEVISEVADWIMKKDSDMIGNISRKKSPLRLTPIGETIYRDSGAKAIVDEHIEELMSAIATHYPQTAFDVESSASKVAYEKLSAPYFKPIKDFLYLAPEPYYVCNPETGEEEPVTLNIITMSHIISLPLRDEYLKRHPELDPMQE